MTDTTRKIAEMTLSKKAFDRRRRHRDKKKILRALLLICFFGVVVLMVTSLQLGRVKIKEIRVKGNQHYTAEELTLALNVQVGDPMYGFDTKTASEALISVCPYLRTVRVEPSLGGVLELVVEERTPLWALEYQLKDQSLCYVLLDEQLMALEHTAQVGDACLLRVWGIALPHVGESLIDGAKRAEREYDAWKKEQGTDVATPDYSGAASRLADKLRELTGCYPDMTAADAPILLDLTTPYDRFLVVRDGTCYLLGDAADLPQLLAKAATAIALYRAEHPEMLPETELLVDLRDASRVLISQNRSVK
jgi:hypothetical protein